MIITVTQLHIERGVRENCDRCPIALACLDLGISASVDCATIDVLGEEWLYNTFEMPDEAAQFIAAFDAGRGVEPFSFEMPDCMRATPCPQ